MRQQIVPPPEGFDPKGVVKRGAAWCPYCGRIQEFGWDAAVEAARCAGCGISNRDFWVRKFNGLFQDGPMAAFERVVVRSGRVKGTPVFPWEKGIAAGAGLALGLEEVERTRACAVCGEQFAPASPRQKYCPACQAEKQREWQRESMRRRRAAAG